MRITVLMVFAFLLCSSLEAQKKADHIHTVGYHNNLYGGLQINNHGVGIQLRRGFHKTVKLKKIYDFDFVTLSHPKEVKQSNSEAAKSFVYGKLNEAFLLRAGIGQQKTLAYKPLNGGVELKLIYSGGLTLAFLKPVYYLINYQESSLPVEEKFNEETHEIHNIVGSASYFKGFGEMKLLPGIYGKFALNFEYASSNTGIRAIETGVLVDGFYKNVEILAFDKNYPLYISFYLAVQYGKKWYR